MNSSSMRAIGLMSLIAVSWSAACEAGQPAPAAATVAASTEPTARSSAQFRVGLVLVAADEQQAPLPALAELDFPASPNAVMCRSEASTYRECATPFRGNVVLSRELSGTGCVDGGNWGWREGAVWVDNGCAAVFLKQSAAIAVSNA